jgi:DNA/RNA-binding domain of Phe-tRNA-synthetase-like protein
MNVFFELPSSQAVAMAFPNVSVIGTIARLSPRADAKPDLDDEWRRVAVAWEGRGKGDLHDAPIVRSYLGFFEALGVDTKRKPPSMVNLIQRFILKTHPNGFPRIHPIVDVVNVAAVESLIPLGAFDAAAIHGPLRVAMSMGGEPFLALGADKEVQLDPNRLILRDDANVLSEFGIRDSQHQRIQQTTEQLMLLACQVPGVERAEVERGLNLALDLLSRSYSVERTTA